MRAPKRLLATIAAIAAAAGTVMMTGASPAFAGGGLWKIDCKYSHTNSDDPIVYPGQPGASHLHDFYGNISTNAYSNYSSMDGVTSTCTHNDRAAYWTPTLYRNGQVVHSDTLVIYYDVGAYKAAKIEPFPKDFKIIYGNKNATTAAQVPGNVYWGCKDDTQISYTRRVPPTNCAASKGIQLRVQFPSCWDGVTVAGNELDHMAYPSGGNCPKGFPHAFPRIGFHATYYFGTADTGTITFSSGNVYSAHVDFWNTWDQSTLQTLTSTCLNTASYAGSNVGPNCGHFKGTGGSPGKPAPVVTQTSAPAVSPTTKAPSAPVVTATTPATTTGGTKVTPTPCPATAAGDNLALTSATSPLTGSKHSLVSTLGLVAVGLIILFEGGLVTRRVRRRVRR